MHLGMYFPGGYGPGQDPFDNYLAWMTIRALEQAGALVVPVRYDDSILAPDPQRFEDGVRREVNGALAHYQPDRLTVVGKSRGTHALRVVCSGDFNLPDDTRLVWQTPNWRSDRSWQAACSNRRPSLHIIGLADHEFHEPERHREVFGETVAIKDADHGLDVKGDIFATLEAWRTMVSAVVQFAARG